MSEKDIYKYPGEKVDIYWDGRLCIHIGECGRAKNELFVSGRQPWGQPDLVSEEEVIDVIERCPTGALTYKFKDGSVTEAPVAENTVVVNYNGPLVVRGDLAIEGASIDMEGVRFRASLCRCGESKNKPFCDNSHEAANFKDYGAVGETGEGLQERGGQISITPLQDGPLLLSGNLTIKASSGRTAWEGKNAALCRCGQSQNKPFCDGAHVAAGFKSE